MSYLIDANVISDIRRGDGRHPGVARWYAALRDDEVYRLGVSVLNPFQN